MDGALAFYKDAAPTALPPAPPAVAVSKTSATSSPKSPTRPRCRVMRSEGSSEGSPRGDSKVSVTRDGDTLTQKSCYPVYSPFGIEGSTRADPVVPPSFRFLGFFFLAQGRCVRQASRPRRIASMALSSRSTCTASAKGLSRALSLCSSAFFPALTCALACTRSYGVCGSS